MAFEILLAGHKPGYTRCGSHCDNIRKLDGCYRTPGQSPRKAVRFGLRFDKIDQDNVVRPPMELEGRYQGGP